MPIDQPLSECRERAELSNILWQRDTWESRISGIHNTVRDRSDWTAPHRYRRESLPVKRLRADEAAQPAEIPTPPRTLQETQV